MKESTFITSNAAFKLEIGQALKLHSSLKQYDTYYLTNRWKQNRFLPCMSLSVYKQSIWCWWDVAAVTGALYILTDFHNNSETDDSKYTTQGF